MLHHLNVTPQQNSIKIATNQTSNLPQTLLHIEQQLKKQPVHADFFKIITTHIGHNTPQITLTRTQHVKKQTTNTKTARVENQHIKKRFLTNIHHKNNHLKHINHIQHQLNILPPNKTLTTNHTQQCHKQYRSTHCQQPGTPIN